MERYCDAVAGRKVANLVEDGRTPWLEAAQLEAMGYSVVLYPVSLLMHNIKAMQGAAKQLREDGVTRTARASFDEARALVGWPDYEARLRELEESEPSS